MNFFENFTQFRQNTSDVAFFPHRQLASKVFRMVEQTYMTNWDNPITLRSDVSPEMLEACFSCIFGKTLMTQVAERLPVLVKQLRDYDIDEMWASLIGQSKLLSEIAEKSAWGTPATEDVDEITFLIFCLLGGQSYMDRFVGQTIKRIATVH